MKKATLALVAFLSLFPTMSFAGPDDSADFSKVNLEMTCKLARRYLDAAGNVAVEDLTPKTAKAKKVVISNGNGEMPLVEIAFDANTVDGKMTLKAAGSAFSAVGDWYNVAIFHALTLESKDLSVIGTNDSKSGQASDPYFQSASPIMVSVGHTPEGNAKNEYTAFCEIKRVN